MINSRIRMNVPSGEKGIIGRRLFAVLASIRHTLRHRSLIWITTDADGDWCITQNSIRIYSPTYCAKPVEIFRAEMHDIWDYARPLRSGDTVVDIGAGGGEDVVFLSKIVGSSGKVIAVEAHPTTFRCLEKTIRRNRLQNVIAAQVAVDENDGEIKIETGQISVGNRTGVGSTNVRSMTIDNLLRSVGISSPTLVKMNIEGAETAALAGASSTLHTTAHWIVSCHDFLAHQPGYEKSATLADVTRALTTAGLQTLPLRADPRPWIQYYVYASRPS